MSNYEREKWVCLFQARQQDLKLSNHLDHQFSRFVSIINAQAKNKLILRDQGFGQNAAKMLARILGNSTHLTSIDLSMNNLSAGLDCLADGLIANDRIVCLKLKNNNIDGR